MSGILLSRVESINDTKKTANVNNGTEIIGLKDKELMLKKQFINSKTSG